MSSKRNRFLLICIAVTLVLLAVILIVLAHQRAQIAPVLELTVDGLTAETPSEVQRLCRSDFERYAELMQKHEDCVWLWCGEDRLCLARQEVLTKLDVQSGFTQVAYTDKHGDGQTGWIIDPAAAPNELGRISLNDSEEASFDSVSMSVRVALREGKIGFTDAVYLWEEGSSEVLAVNSEAVSDPAGAQISFTDDGGVMRNCYVLDTAL